VETFDFGRYAMGFCVVVTALATLVAPCRANIPPPQRFEPSKTTPGKSQKVLVISASDVLERGQQEHPSGAVFATDGWCRVILSVSAGSGAHATLNVSGSSNPLADFGADRGWTPETAPIAISNASSETLSKEITVPLRHRIIEFFLSTRVDPGRPEVGSPVGGPILIYATASSCSFKQT
jgi:hypothetical protein